MKIVRLIVSSNEEAAAFRRIFREYDIDAPIDIVPDDPSPLRIKLPAVQTENSLYEGEKMVFHVILMASKSILT